MDSEALINNIYHYSSLTGKYATFACDEAGVGKSFISDIKRGRIPSVRKIQKLAAYFGITTSELLGEELPEEPKLPRGMTPEGYASGCKYDRATTRDKQLVDAILEPYEDGD